MSKSPKDDRAFGILLQEIAKNGQLWYEMGKDELYSDIAGFIRDETNRACEPETVRKWFDGKARPWRSPAKTKALYQFFVEAKISNKALLVRLLILCEYPQITSLIQELIPPPTSGWIPNHDTGIVRADILKEFHKALLTKRKRGVGVFLLGCPHNCGSSTILLQMIRRYQGIDNALLSVPFTKIVYVDCAKKHPTLGMIGTAIFRRFSSDPVPHHTDWATLLHPLLEGQALLLALDNVPDIRPASEVARFLQSLGAPHIIVMASNRRVWQHPILFVVNGFTWTEMQEYAVGECPAPFVNNQKVLQRVWVLTGGIPGLVLSAFKSLATYTHFNEQSDYQDLSSKVGNHVQEIYRPAWKRLKNHPEWDYIKKLLNALPLTAERIDERTFRKKAQLLPGEFSSAIDALLDEFLIVAHGDGIYDIPYPFRWFAIPRTTPPASS